MLFSAFVPDTVAGDAQRDRLRRHSGRKIQSSAQALVPAAYPRRTRRVRIDRVSTEDAMCRRAGLRHREGDRAVSLIDCHVVDRKSRLRVVVQNRANALRIGDRRVNRVAQVTLKFSVSSYTASSVMLSVIVCVVTPAAKFRVPLKALVPAA